MALITCPDCGKQHSDAAPACPNCGRPTGEASASQSKSQTVVVKKKASPLAIGCLGLVLFVAFFGAIGALVDSCDGTSSASTSNPTDQRRSDSLFVVSHLAGGDTSPGVDDIVHRWGLAIPHERVHVVAMDKRLERIEAQGKGSSTAAGTRSLIAQLDSLPAPINESQQAKAKTLRNRLIALAARQDRIEAAAAVKRAAEARRAYAKVLESRLLDKGLNVTVTTSGANATRLRLEWILVSKVVAHQMAKGSLLTEIQAMGFKHFEITDGYDETWYWDFK